MSSFGLKLFAIIFMFIDHIGVVFFPENMIFRIIGRLAFPLFAFQIGIGYSHTKNKLKHILTMLLFAIISQIPYIMMCSIHNATITLNVLFTFLFALLIIYSTENIKHLVIKIPLIFILFFLAYYVKTDYGILGIILTIFLYYFSSNKLLTLCGLIFIMFSYCYFSNSAPIQLYAILSFIFMWLFNGKKGPNAKWLFYTFYPLHMIILFYAYKLLL